MNRAAEVSPFQMRLEQVDALEISLIRVGACQIRMTVGDERCEPSPAEVGAFQMHPLENSTLELRRKQVSAFQTRSVERGAVEMSPFEVGAFEMRFRERGAVETSPVEVDAFEMCSSKAGAVRCAPAKVEPSRCIPRRSAHHKTAFEKSICH